MKIITVFFLSTFIICGCRNETANNTNSNTITMIECEGNLFDSALLSYATQFNPKTPNFNESVDSRLDSIMIHYNSGCLDKYPNVRIAVFLLLEKQYLYNLSDWEKFKTVGTNLLAIKRNNGAFKIITLFKQLTGFHSEDKFLSLSQPFYYVEVDENLKNNYYLKEVHEKIHVVRKKFNIEH